MSILIVFLAAAMTAESWTKFEPDGPKAIAHGVTVGAPFVALILQERTRTAIDGRRITEVKRGKLMRDSAGRERREFEDSPATVLDPIAGSSLYLDPVGKIALRAPLMDVAMDLKTGWSFAGLTSLPDRVAMRRTEEGHACRVVALRSQQGLSAEACLSDELRVALEERVVTPDGEYRWRLLDLRRAEPDPSWFQAPEGYEITASPLDLPGRNCAKTR
jgi:hypothetical protein